MKLKAHILQGVALSPIAYYLTDIKSAAIFLASFIFIDIDHYFIHVCRHREIGINKMFEYFYNLLENRRDVYVICVFHTVEFFLILFALGYWQREFFVILAAVLIHFLFDIYHLYKHGAISIRAFSIIEYFIKKGNR